MTTEQTEQQHIKNYTDRIALLLHDTVKDGTDTHTTADRFGGGNAVEVESGEFLCALVKRFNPLTVLETGSHWGFSSSWILTALAWHEESYPRNRQLITVDVSGYEQRAKRLWDLLGVSHLVTQVVGDAGKQETVEEVVKHLIGPLDFAWIDDDHSTETVLREWNLWSPLLNRRNCIVAFHDTRLDPREGLAVKIIYEHLLYDKGLFPKHTLTPVPEGCETPRPTPHKFVQWIPLRNMRGLDFLYLSNEEL